MANLIANGDFDGDIDGWVPAFNSPTLAYDGGETKDPGTGSLKVSFSSVETNSLAAYAYPSPLIAVSEGAELRLQAWARTLTGSVTAGIGFDFYDGDDGETANFIDYEAGDSTVNSALVADGSWQHLTIDLTVPVGATHVAVTCQARGAVGIVWFDGFSLDAVPVTPPAPPAAPAITAALAARARRGWGRGRRG
jgi:hypothetical protein